MALGGGSLHLKAIPKGDRTYYHLATCFRDGGKVRQRVIEHLGTDTEL